jgi:hypothetical protein
MAYAVTFVYQVTTESMRRIVRRIISLRLVAAADIPQLLMS